MEKLIEAIIVTVVMFFAMVLIMLLPADLLGAFAAAGTGPMFLIALSKLSEGGKQKNDN